MVHHLTPSASLRFKGQKKGGVTENASYYIFTQCPDGAFEAFPVHGWYNFTPQAKHRTLTAEEAEEEWGRWVSFCRVSDRGRKGLDCTDQGLDEYGSLPQHRIFVIVTQCVNYYLVVVNW